LGTGERLRWVDMRGTVVPLKVRNTCDSKAPTPFVVSSRGLGVWSSSTAVGRMGFPGRADDSNFACDLGTPPCSVGPPVASVRFCFKAADVAFEIATGSLPALVTRHARSVGLPRAPWLPQLALMQWRDVSAGPSQLLDDIRQMQSRDLPIGWVILDNPWEDGAASGCYGPLVFDPSVFPDPEEMISAIHARGVRFMLWISPQLKKRGCPTPPYPDGWLSGDDEIYVRDLTNPAERADFTNLLVNLVQLGVDGFKGDRGDEVDLEPDRLSGGPGVLLQNAYPLLYARAAASALQTAHDWQFATLFGSFVPGSTRHLPGVVGPDEPQTENGLVGSIRAAQTAGVAGAPVWGTDIGGYQGGTLTPELFVRWAQFSALTPIFEVGGAGANATFWQLGPDAISGFRAAATLHYELAPFLYQLAVDASHDGMPVVRPLGLTWPHDPRAWSHDLEITVGNALLAAPLTGSKSTTSVYLPAGTWFDAFRGTRVVGPATVTRTSEADDFPLYVRAGSSFADNFRTPALWGSDPWRTNDLVRGDRQGWVIAASARTTSVAHDRGSTLTATTSSTGDIAVRLTHARRQQQFRVFSPVGVCSVISDGARVAFARDPSIAHAFVFTLDAAPATLTLSVRACE
jgi:alpha-D-xyloside xylohydrolase